MISSKNVSLLAINQDEANKYLAQRYTFARKMSETVNKFLYEIKKIIFLLKISSVVQNFRKVTR